MYVVIAGAGLVGGELARKLMANKHDVVVIETDKEICDKLYAETGAIVINGSATRIEVLKESNIVKADAVVAATGNDADNLAFAILSKSFTVPNIIVRMRDPDYINAYNEVGVNAIVRVTDLLVNQILMEIEKPKVRKIMTICEGRAEIFILTVPQGAKVAGKSLKDITENNVFPPQCVFIAVYNREKEEFSIPRGQQVVNEGDELFLISTAEDIKRAADFLTAKT